MKECRYGLALEGGGARGAYQIGAYKALVENGFKFDAIVGTSIGAINAAIICQGGIELLEELWNKIDSTIFDIDTTTCDEILNKNKTAKVKTIVEI